MRRRDFLGTLSAVGASLAFSPALQAQDTPQRPDSISTLLETWNQPPRSYRPHTRWWWPGSAVSRDEVRRQLEGMRSNGIGGVELTCIWDFYEAGNLAYLSKPWLEMVTQPPSGVASRALRSMLQSTRRSRGRSVLT
jgi:hypothetical protein